LNEKELRTFIVVTNQGNFNKEQYEKMMIDLANCTHSNTTHLNNITYKDIANCSKISKLLKEKYEKKLKNKFEVREEIANDVAFVMVHTNASEVQDRLDTILYVPILISFSHFHLDTKNNPLCV